mmetsp:Transcript_25661/g.77968  ORF Transcript_25661/g.77968 Transcript_25661/m.77968 type:complete len:156 (-) Transcript_25661:316-783(-)
MAWKLLALLSLLGGASAAASEQSIEDLMASLKGMPGMEGIKMFTADDLKNMDPEKMAQQMAGGRGGRPKRRTRGQWKRELIAFYESHGLQDKIAGVDAALDKWKGREQKMWDALQTKYADLIASKAEENAIEANEAEERMAKAEAAADAAFKKEL